MYDIQKIKKSVFATLTQVPSSVDIGSGFRKLVTDLYVNPDALPYEVSSRTFKFLGKNISGLCIRNKNGGYEFFNSEYMVEPVTILHPGTSIILQRRNHRTEECCIFLSLLDYIGFMNLLYNESLPEGISHPCDCFIIGDESNLIDAMLDTDCYSRNYCFFSWSLIGRTISKTFIHRNPKVNIDMSGFYQEFGSIFEYNKRLYSEIFDVRVSSHKDSKNIP